MFDNLDFSKLKLPIEPQNLIYIYIAYKLINSLDKIDLSRLGGNVRVPASNPFMVSSISKQSQLSLWYDCNHHVGYKCGENKILKN